MMQLTPVLLVWKNPASPYSEASQLTLWCRRFLDCLHRNLREFLAFEDASESHLGELRSYALARRLR